MNVPIEKWESWGKLVKSWALASTVAGFVLGGVLTPPLGLQGVSFRIPPDNPLTAEKVALGRQLFFDQRLSPDNTVSCATCHDPRQAFTDGRARSVGLKGRRTSRNASTLINRALGRSFFWDGRASSLEELVLEVMQLPATFGTTREALVKTLNRIQGYRRQFQLAFGGEVTAERAAMALAAFVRTLLSGGSTFDRFEEGDETALSPAARQGLALFRGKAGCARCHTGPNFTDEKFHNTGVGLYHDNPDLGRYRVTGRDEDKGAFKTPTLRDVAKTAPYMHDGSLGTLEEVVAYYDRGAIKNPYLDLQIRSLRLSLREKKDLVAFLKSLTGKEMAVEQPELPR